MTRILVLYYSSYGHVRTLADAVAEGARTVAGATVDIRRIPETVPEDVRKSAGFVEDDTPVAAPADLADYDGILFGTPTRFGLMAGQMKQFIDMTGPLWAQGKLVNKVASSFTSAATGIRPPSANSRLRALRFPVRSASTARGSGTPAKCNRLRP